MRMINCSEHGSHQIHWRGDEVFGVRGRYIAQDRSSEHGRNQRQSESHEIEITCEATDDLINLLKLDRKRAVVQIFHHTAFLKENLRLTRDQPGDWSTSEYIKLGALPRQLALETLATLQTILFPLTEAKSKALLLSLTSTTTQNFDTDVLRYDSSTIRNSLNLETIPYHYFGSRLGDLYEEMSNPTPRGMEKWFERRSGARYVMMTTIVGVFLAIFLGMASLALGGYQAWVGYQQWQHPVNPQTSV